MKKAKKTRHSAYALETMQTVYDYRTFADCAVWHSISGGDAKSFPGEYDFNRTGW